VKPRNPELEELDLTSYQDLLVAHCLDPHFQLRVTRVRENSEENTKSGAMIEDAIRVPVPETVGYVLSGLNLVRSHLMIRRGEDPLSRETLSGRTGKRKSNGVIFSEEDYE